MSAKEFDHVGQLWLQWGRVLSHDMRTAVTGATGYARLIGRGTDNDGRPFSEDQVRQLLDYQQNCLAQLSSWLTLVNMCSAGRRASLSQLTHAYTEFFGARLTVNREGDLDVPCPSETLGFVLWLLLESSRPVDGNMVLEVAVTRSIGRIAIGQPDAEDRSQWKDIDTTESWWFVDAIAHLKASGYQVEAGSRGDRWFIVASW